MMNKKYKYKTRPCYNSSELLIEFVEIEEPNKFIEELLEILKGNNFNISHTSDVWTNDEIWIHCISKNGEIILTKDIWDLIFILGKNNQTDINNIDQILNASEAFERIQIDFSEYKTDKN